MSRGPSPIPSSSHAYADYAVEPSPPPRPARAPLRVNTEAAHLNGTSRLRSNSAQSSHTTPHQFSRSLSQSAVAVAPSSPVNARGKYDVAMAVNGLRAKDVSPVTEEPAGEEQTLRRIGEALDKSSDKGDTLDLSRRGITNIGPEAVERFAKGVGADLKGVWRLALSYNALRDQSIHESFCRLSRLRYLNLKGNAFTEFPAALTDLAALEILDLSKNHIQAFPERPGRLAHLKVLSLTNNRIYALPSYLTTFNSLKVFKVDDNPIEWPPREVLGNLIDLEQSGGRRGKDEDLRPWIENMKSWMRQRAADGDRILAQNREDEAYLASEEEPASAVSASAYSSDMPQWGSQMNPAPSTSTIRPIRDESGRASPLHQRIPLLSRNRSATMSDESLTRPISPGLYPPNRPFARHDRSQSNSSYTPPHSASTASSSSHSRPPSALQAPLLAPSHSRGASYTATQRLSANLTAKKSLPDLRQSHAKIIQDRRNEPGETVRPLGLGINTQGSSRWATPITWTEEPPRTLLRQGSADMLRDAKRSDQDSSEKPLADESRNSYFRRLSTLPKSTISKTIPPALLKFVDAIRGILFALSQLHAALRQYLLFAVPDRVAGVFNRVMEPAGTYMINLINALDRFDSMSRRGIPPASAVRSVVNATKESVAVSSKVVAVLRLQMPALSRGDVRYTRTLLLMIYGSMAEVGCSWSAMEPLLIDIKPLLHDRPGGIAMALSGSLGRTPISPIPERGESRSPSSAARSSMSTVNASPNHPSAASMETPAPVARAQRRRQAGSFSTEDVERGMLMGSPGVVSDTNDDRPAFLRHRPSESAQVVLEDQTEESEEEELMPLPMPPFAKTSRSGSLTGVPVTPPELSQHLVGVVQPTQPRHAASSSAGSLSMPGPLRKLSVDVQPPTPASATLYDEDLLDVIESATDIAFTVWLKLAEDINADSPVRSMHQKSASQSSFASTIDSARASDRTIPAKHHSELVLLLSRAEQITTALRESLAGLRANPATWNHTSLPDDAQAFIKTVVRVSALVKTISATHAFPPGVRQSCSRLTQATRECAILIQVSSLRPGASTPAPIPSARPTSPGYRLPSTAASSVEDLSVPHSAGWNGPPSSGSSGLRGLRLPSRHAARQGGSGSGSVRGDPPKSAQASQLAFG